MDYPRALPLALAALLAGCSSPSVPAASADPPARLGPGVFVVSEGGIEPADGLPGLDVDVAQGRYAFDMMEFVQPDLAFVVLLEALGNQSIEAQQDSQIEVPGVQPNPEGRDSRDFCIFGMMEANVPGPALLERAQGRAANIEDEDRSYGWSLWVGPDLPITFGYGNSGGLGATLAKGEWLAVTGAESGITESDLKDPVNSWTVTVTTDGELRVYLLPAATFLCGRGFTRFPGAVGSTVAYTGGHSAVQDRYGSTATFDAAPVDAAAAGVVDATSEATLRFRGKDLDLGPVSNVWRASYEPAESSITNDHWVGSPTWMLAGISVPHPDQVGLDNGNGTR